MISVKKRIRLITNFAAGPGRWAVDHRWLRSAASASSPAAQGWAERSSGHRSPWPQHPSLTGSPNKGMKNSCGVNLSLYYLTCKGNFILYMSELPMSIQMHTFLLKSSLLSISWSLVTSCFIISEFLSVESEIHTHTSNHKYIILSTFLYVAVQCFCTMVRNNTVFYRTYNGSPRDWRVL